MMKVGAIESLSNSTPLIKVNPSALFRAYAQHYSNGHYTSAIREPFAQRSSIRMHLYNTLRDTMAKYLILQILCSASCWSAPRLMPNIFII